MLRDFLFVIGMIMSSYMGFTYLRNFGITEPKKTKIYERVIFSFLVVCTNILAMSFVRILFGDRWEAGFLRTSIF